MKNNPTTTILNWALSISLLVLFVGGLQYLFRTRAVRSIQAEMSNFQNRQVLLNSFANDVVEYSKRNPAIDPILVSLRIKADTSTPAGTTKPVNK